MAALRDCPFGTAPRAGELHGGRPASYHSSAQSGARAFSMRPVPEAPEQILQRLRRCSPSGFARKWRHKGLKRLNPRLEMVWPENSGPQHLVQERDGAFASLPKTIKSTTDANAEFGCGNGFESARLPVRPERRRRASSRPRRTWHRRMRAPERGGKFSWLQSLEKPQNGKILAPEP